MNRKVNTSRYRQRATLHFSCHRLQAWDHKSTALSVRQPLYTVRTIHKTCPYALCYQPSWFTVCTVSKLNTNRTTWKYILLQPLSENCIAQVMSVHSSFTSQYLSVIFGNNIPTAVPPWNLWGQRRGSRVSSFKARALKSGHVSKMRLSDSNSWYLAHFGGAFTSFL